MGEEFSRKFGPANAAEDRTLSVIVPARNEAASIGDCLDSLTRQSEEEFLLGRDWELFVVDDGSTDATRQIALKFPAVTLLDAPPLPPGWTGKSNALWFAAQRARGKWLLFTDADTIHEPGGLRRAMHEAERHHAAMLSYAPRQLVNGFWQRATMPLIFADLAQKYPPRLVNNSDSSVAACCGQFLLIGNGMYRRIGGHEAVHGSLIEDMELARLCKRAHGGLRFRHAPDALLRGFWKLVQAGLFFGLPLLAVWLYLIAANAGLIWAVALWWVWRVRVHYAHVAKSHFPARDILPSPLALPLFGWMLLDSWIRKNLHRPARWKGRTYPA